MMSDALSADDFYLTQAFWRRCLACGETPSAKPPAAFKLAA
jgi:hypothetical protein